MYPPTVLTAPITNKRYMVDGENWIEVPLHTTVQDAQKLHRQMFPAYYSRPEPPHIVSTKKVMSSKGDKFYEVSSWSDGKRACTCSGFVYRRACKHTA